MRELQILIAKLDEIIKGYLCSGRFGDMKFDLNNIAEVTAILSQTRINKKKSQAVSEESVESDDTISMVTSALTTGFNTSTAKIAEWLENGIRFLSDTQITSHRYPTLAWLYAVRNKLVDHDQQFNEMKSIPQLREYNQSLFSLINELFKTVNLLLHTPSDNDEPIIKKMDDEKYRLIGLKDNESILAPLLRDCLSAGYYDELIRSIEDEISKKELLIAALNRSEKQTTEANKMRADVKALQSQLSVLASELAKSRQQEKLRLRDLGESQQRLQQLTSELDLKSRQHSDLQRNIESIRAEKIKLSEELALQPKDDGKAELVQELEALQKKYEAAEANAANALHEASQLKEEIEYERSLRSELQSNVSDIKEHQAVVEKQMIDVGLVNVNVVGDSVALGDILKRAFAEAEEEEPEVDEIEQEELVVVLNKEVMSGAQIPSYPHVVEPAPELHCTKAQDAVYRSDYQALHQALTAEPFLLNAICRNEHDAIGAKSLIEIALFHTYHTFRKQVDKLNILRYLLERRPDLDNTVLYENIKSQLPRAASDLQLEYCRYAVAHRTCTAKALVEFEEKAEVMNEALTFLKDHKNHMPCENKSVSELLADLQNVLHAYQLLCDGYLSGHFESFKSNTSQFVKDPKATQHAVLLNGLEQNEEDERFKRKTGRHHYMAEILQSLEPKYAVLQQLSYGGTVNKFESKVVQLSDAEQQEANDSRIPYGIKLSTNVDELQQPLIAAYGTLIKNLFLVISRYGVVMSTPDGFNDYQIKMINLHLAAKLQAEKLENLSPRFGKRVGY